MTSVALDEDPARAVRTKRDATVRIAARLVRDRGPLVLLDAGAPAARTGLVLRIATVLGELLDRAAGARDGDEQVPAGAVA